MMTDFHMGGAGFGMGLWWILIVVLIAAAGRMLFSRSRNDGTAGSPPSAREILDRRYANGEIDAQEYAQKKQDLAQ